jgi:hypothetical protein
MAINVVHAQVALPLAWFRGSTGIRVLGSLLGSVCLGPGDGGGGSKI